MAEIDDKAFDNMRRLTDRAPDRMFKEGRLFTESEYNTRASTKERLGYDQKAYSFLQDLFQEDLVKRSDIKDWDFDRYLVNLKNSYLEEKFIESREGDPDFYGKAGEMLRSVYSDDVDQLKLSARNISTQRRDRANVSIKAPQAEQY